MSQELERAFWQSLSNQPIKKPELTKHEDWKQPTPAMQLIVLHMALEGEFLNLDEGISTVSEYVRATEPLFESLRELQPFIEKGSW